MWTKRIAIFIFFLFLCLFHVQKKWHIIKERPLNGSFTPAYKPIFSWKKWFAGTWQPKAEVRLNEHFGLRTTMVRMNNEINYHLFKTTATQDVVFGKEGFLYEKKHIEQYYGYDFIGEDIIKHRIEKLRVVTDTLAKHGVKLIFIAAPSKADYFPEYIPDAFKMQPSGNNYTELKKQLDAQHLSYIDFNKWFIEMKPSAKYPLYPQTGTHWSVYGMHLALDSIVKFLENNSARTLTHFDYSNVTLSDSLQDPDGDIELSLNLLRQSTHYKMAYPVVNFIHKENEWHPRLLTIADSYWMGIFYKYLPHEIFTDHRFWYYNQQRIVYFGPYTDVSALDIKAEAENSDYIFIVATVQNAKNIGWGWIEMMYDIYTKGNDYYAKFRADQKDIFKRESIKGGIMGDNKWLYGVMRQAEGLHIALDSAIKINIEYNFPH